MDQTNDKSFVIFSYSGRFAHFLRAESSASALTYPVPPRTVLLGLLGAVLGLPKDTPQIELKETMLTIIGSQNFQTHWHLGKFRKEIPAPLPNVIKAGMKGGTKPKPEKATLIRQEWLIKPSYRVIASLPEAYHNNFVERLKTKSWHYSPCLGLSEMNADLDFVAEVKASAVQKRQSLLCESIVPQDSAEIDGEELKKLLETKKPLSIQVLRMPCDLSKERVFTHRNYLIEKNGHPIPISTSKAWNITTNRLKTFSVMFL